VLLGYFSADAANAAVGLTNGAGNTDNVNSALAAAVATPSSGSTPSGCAALTGYIVVVVAVSPAAVDSTNRITVAVVVQVYSSSNPTASVDGTVLGDVCQCLQTTLTHVAGVDLTWENCNIGASQKRYLMQSSNDTIFYVNMTSNPVNGSVSTSGGMASSGTSGSASTGSASSGSASSGSAGTSGTSTGSNPNPNTTPSNSGSGVVPGFVVVFVSLLLGCFALFKIY